MRLLIHYDFIEVYARITLKMIENNFVQKIKNKKNTTITLIA